MKIINKTKSVAELQTLLFEMLYDSRFESDCVKLFCIDKKAIKVAARVKLKENSAKSVKESENESR